MNITSNTPDVSTSKIKRYVNKARDAFPYRIVKKGNAETLERDDAALVTFHGEDYEVDFMDMDLDDMALESDDKECAITSEPIKVKGMRLFFTRGGFQGTMAINKDTLLDTDAYKVGTASNDRIAQAINENDGNGESNVQPSDVADMDEKRLKELLGDEYAWMGDITELMGSKQTLKEHNQAKRERKLLKANTMNRKKALMFLAAGTLLGYVLKAQGVFQGVA